jgi:bifunctional DNA-binding transcriptional regulator/antitoxin component of YhaV-PrlF toxin-antitoxin module
MTAAASTDEATMATTRLDKNGRLSLPQDLLGSHHWRAGTEFVIEDRPEGLLLRPLHEQRRTLRETAPGHGDGGGRDRALADAMRDRMARYGH